jgi:hypothetical protein
VPKEQPAQQPAATAMGGPDAQGMEMTRQQAGEEIEWDVPTGWHRKAASAEGGMRYATFELDGAPGAEVTVVPLGGEAGTVQANVNRWEGQLGLPVTSEKDLGTVTQEVETQSGPATVVRLKGEKQAMLASMVKHGGSTWFIKLMGPTDAVEKQQDAFDAFVKSTRFVDAAGPNAAAPTPSGESAAHEQQAAAPTGISYDAPAGWEREGPKPMREVSFVVGGKGEVIVTRLPQGVGDLLMNVNRWRGQVGLGPLEEVGKVGQELTVGGAKGTMYDFTGTERRQIVVVVNRQGSDWYFKVIGPKDVVEKERGEVAAYHVYSLCRGGIRRE